MRPLLNYYGGKWNAADWIISHFPDHEIFVEVFGGGASVLLKKHRSRREVLNDIDDEIVNLYHMVRDHGEELKQACSLTPCSRSEYKTSMRISCHPLERARRTIVRSYFGIGESNHRNNSGMRTSKTANTCVAKSWVNWWEAVGETVERFRGVVIENLSWRELVLKYDTPQTLFYFDPPYPLETRNRRHKYTHDFTDSDHIDFVNFMDSIQGFRIISGYRHRFYDRLGWRREEKLFSSNNSKKPSQECLWICPRVEAQEKQTSMDLSV